METLQLKIYNTLLEKLPIPAFEEWLYDQEVILNQLENDSFLHTIVTMNYQLENSLSQLEYESSIKYGGNFTKVLAIERCCIQILRATDKKSYYTILQEMMIEFDIFSTTSLNLSWEFYSCYEQLGMMYVDSEILEKIYFEAENLAKKTLTKLEACNSFRAKKEIVFQKPFTVIKTQPDTSEQNKSHKKISLRKKIARFFAYFARVH